jgi:hypothetical protein
VAFSVVELFWQIVVVPVMLGVGLAFTITVDVVLPVHPLALLTVTVYVPAVEVAMEDVVAPVFHKYELNPAVAVRVVDVP